MLHYLYDNLDEVLFFSIIVHTTSFAQLQTFAEKVPGWTVAKEQESKLSKPNFPSRQGLEVFYHQPM